MRCYLFDIDGTIADLTHRLHHIQPQLRADGHYGPKNWDAFFAECVKDKAIDHICRLIEHLSHRAAIVLVSGRSDQVRAETIQWLSDNDVVFASLYMRTHGDHRPDYLIKGELLDQIVADGYKPIMAFDDRDQVVKMWRERGVPCAQVADGNF